jgi:hypothetical protein
MDNEKDYAKRSFTNANTSVEAHVLSFLSGKLSSPPDSYTGRCITHEPTINQSVAFAVGRIYAEGLVAL